MPRQHASSQHARNRLSPAAPLLALLMLGAPGCYNGEVLTERVRNDALKHRLEEIDLGMYSITMPRDPETSETLEVEMHLFGSLARYRQAEVERRLEDLEFLLRHQTLMVVRTTDAEDFTDPDLTGLRSRLLLATNKLLKEPSIQSIGFHEIRFMRH